MFAGLTLSFGNWSNMFLIRSRVGAAGKDKLVVLWNIQDQVSSLSGSLATPGKHPAKTGDEKHVDSPKVGPRSVFQGHEDTVEDVQFAPSRYQSHV